MPTYTIYHVVGIKVGATKDFKTRSMQNRMTYGQDVVIEVLQRFTTKDRVLGDALASQLEAEAAKQYGYKSQNSYTNAMAAMQAAGHSVRMHPNNKAHDPEFWRGIAPKGHAVLYEQVGCPYCPVVGSYRIMQRWHFDRCKAKPLDNIGGPMETILQSED